MVPQGFFPCPRVFSPDAQLDLPSGVKGMSISCPSLRLSGDIHHRWFPVLDTLIQVGADGFRRREGNWGRRDAVMDRNCPGNRRDGSPTYAALLPLSLVDPLRKQSPGSGRGEVFVAYCLPEGSRTLTPVAWPRRVKSSVPVPGPSLCYFSFPPRWGKKVEGTMAYRSREAWP